MKKKDNKKLKLCEKCLAGSIKKGFYCLQDGSLRQRYFCLFCKVSFCETTGTLLYKKRKGITATRVKKFIESGKTQRQAAKFFGCCLRTIQLYLRNDK